MIEIVVPSYVDPPYSFMIIVSVEGESSIAPIDYITKQSLFCGSWLRVRWDSCALMSTRGIAH